MVYEQLVTAGAAQSFHAEVVVVATLGLVLVVLVDDQADQLLASGVFDELVLDEEDDQLFQSSRL